MSELTITKNNFWNTDLKDIEASFLPKDKKITDLPTVLDNRVPPQGSVLLRSVANSDNEIPSITILQKIKYFLNK
ncbi:MAG: hypothetical protein U9O24_01500 [Campylobacterota bacterium]|nr:hypothetical protein [Campylobacterota bacterium]